MARTTIGANQVTENMLEDLDGDTSIQVEESADEDKIRFDTAGTERMIIHNSGNVGIGTSAPEVMLHLNSTADASLSNNSSGVLMIGANTGNNITIDNNEIMARNNTTADILHLQAEGGTIRVHHSMSTSKKVVITGAGSVGVGTVSPNSKIEVDGPIATAVTSAKTSNYTVTASDSTILVDAANGPVTITLPTASGITGRIYTIKSVNSASVADIATNGSEMIDGSSSNVSLITAESLMLQCDGSGWIKIAAYTPPPP